MILVEKNEFIYKFYDIQMDMGEKVLKLVVPINMDFGLEKNDFNLRAVKPWVWQFCVLFHRYLSVLLCMYMNVYGIGV
jgi:hypothetical protein